MAAILWRGDELRCNSLLSLARTLKYEEVYLHGYGSPSEAQQGLCKHFEFYNHRHLHCCKPGPSGILLLTESK